MKKIFILLIVLLFIPEVKSQVIGNEGQSNTIKLKSESKKKNEETKKIELPEFVLLPRTTISLIENSDTTKDIIRIEAKITNIKSENEVTLKHQNEKSHQIPKVEKILNGFKFSWEINLTEGQNEFEIIAVNDTKSESKKFSIEYKKPQPPPQILNIDPHDNPTIVKENLIRISSEIKNVENAKYVFLKRADNKGFEPAKEEPSTNGLKLTWEVTLNEGQNEFELTAYNSSGGQDRRNFRIIYNPMMGIQKWAVVIGISQYQHVDRGIVPLRYADADAKAFYDFLKSPNSGGFPTANMKLLMNEDATKANIERAINVFLAKAIEKDIVIIYFSGHGSPDPNNQKNLFFLTYDAEPDSMASSAYLMDNLRTALEKFVKAKRVLIFADACHSAAISDPFGTRSTSEEKDLMVKYILNLAQSESSTLVFSASEVNEKSHESEKWGGGHGVFTWAILKGATGEADMDKNGVITIGELIDYTENLVQRETGSQQHPVRSSTKYDRNLPFSVVKVVK
jgi:hypothetical protein